MLPSVYNAIAPFSTERSHIGNNIYEFKSSITTLDYDMKPASEIWVIYFDINDNIRQSPIIWNDQPTCCLPKTGVFYYSVFTKCNLIDDVSLNLESLCYAEMEPKLPVSDFPPVEIYYDSSNQKLFYLNPTMRPIEYKFLKNKN